MTMTVTRLPSPEWRERLQMSSTGAIKSNLFNAITAVRGIRPISDRFWWDDFRHRILVSGKLPWKSDTDERSWSDYDDAKLTEYVQASDVPVTLDLVQRAVVTVSMEQRRNCIQEWLECLRWDGTPRIGKWLTYHLGVEESPYSDAVGRAWLISAVARAMQPGCKADCVLILEGYQGIGKSSAMRALAGAEYFTDEIGDLGSKDAALQMQGAWVVELAELDVVSRSAIERTKAFLSRSTDRYRPPYGRHVIDQPRQCVFVGTSNDVEFRDATGNRRFWPVEVRHIDMDGIKAEREQLWAEALTAYRAGEPWWLTDRDVIEEAKEQQANRMQAEVWGDVLSEWLSGKDKTTVNELLRDALKVETGRWTRADEMRISSYLKSSGWVKTRRRTHGDRSYFYLRDFRDNDRLGPR